LAPLTNEKFAYPAELLLTPPPYANPSHSTSFTKLKVCFVWGAWHRKVHSTGRILKTAHLGRPPVSFCLLPFHFVVNILIAFIRN